MSTPGSLVRRLAWLFALAVAIPFAAATLALLASDSHVRIPAIAGIATYAAVILSFLGGIEWGLAINDAYVGTPLEGKDRLRATALAWSVMPSLAGWGVLWLPSPAWQLGGALAVFVLVWAGDLALARQGLVPSWFVNLRTAVTAIVAALLWIALYLL